MKMVEREKRQEEEEKGHISRETQGGLSLFFVLPVMLPNMGRCWFWQPFVLLLARPPFLFYSTASCAMRVKRRSSREERQAT